MPNKMDNLGDRMKAYEYVPRIYLTRRIPVILRLDGKAFHTFTRGMKKPFDPVLMRTMQQTMKYLCENIQGCVLGYTQSDEITLVLTDYATVKTDAWFSYNVQKMTSISASMATLAFNLAFFKNVTDADRAAGEDYIKYKDKIGKALFDARVFSVPKEEVTNCLIWRQQDATRNSIEAVGQAYFSAKQLHKKTCNMIQDMLFTEKGVNWNDFSSDCKRGTCCVKQSVEMDMDDPQNPGNKITVRRNKWIVDHNTPIFTQDRNYIDRLL